MSSIHVLDAHILIWFLQGDGRLPREAQAVLEHRESQLVIPVTVLAEACMAVERSRTELPSVQALMSTVEGDPRVELLPLDGDIVKEAVTLSSLPDLHDRFVVASTRVLARRTAASVTLITADRGIIAAGLVDIFR